MGAGGGYARRGGEGFDCPLGAEAANRALGEKGIISEMAVVRSFVEAGKMRARSAETTSGEMTGK